MKCIFYIFYLNTNNTHPSIVYISQETISSLNIFSQDLQWSYLYILLCWKLSNSSLSNLFSIRYIFVAGHCIEFFKHTFFKVFEPTFFFQKNSIVLPYCELYFLSYTPKCSINKIKFHTMSPAKHKIKHAFYTMLFETICNRFIAGAGALTYHQIIAMIFHQIFWGWTWIFYTRQNILLRLWSDHSPVFISLLSKLKTSESISKQENRSEYFWKSFLSKKLTSNLLLKTDEEKSAWSSTPNSFAKGPHFKQISQLIKNKILEKKCKARKNWQKSQITCT